MVVLPECRNDLADSLQLIALRDSAVFLGLWAGTDPSTKHVQLRAAYSYTLRMVEVKPPLALERTAQPVPALGTAQFCGYEPINILTIQPALILYSYRMRDQSPSAQDNFVNAYIQLTQRLLEMHPQQRTALVVATPGMATSEVQHAQQVQQQLGLRLIPDEDT
jgi:hypothetical protein